jgi:hypothetical protein
MNDQAVTTTTDDAPRIEYEGRPLESFDEATLIAMITDLVAQLDAANEALTTAERQIERLKATAGKGFTRGR